MLILIWEADPAGKVIVCTSLMTWVWTLEPIKKKKTNRCGNRHQWWKSFCVEKGGGERRIARAVQNATNTQRKAALTRWKARTHSWQLWPSSTCMYLKYVTHWHVHINLATYRTAMYQNAHLPYQSNMGRSPNGQLLGASPGYFCPYFWAVLW